MYRCTANRALGSLFPLYCAYTGGFRRAHARHASPLCRHGYRCGRALRLGVHVLCTTTADIIAGVARPRRECVVHAAGGVQPHDGRLRRRRLVVLVGGTMEQPAATRHQRDHGKARTVLSVRDGALVCCCLGQRQGVCSASRDPCTPRILVCTWTHVNARRAGVDWYIAGDSMRVCVYTADSNGQHAVELAQSGAVRHPPAWWSRRVPRLTRCLLSWYLRGSPG